MLRYPETRFSLVRPGLSLYGISPLPLVDKAVHLKPILTWKSRIIFLKEVPANTAVSYAGTFVTRRTSRIATAAFGYADGYRRNLSNKGWVLAGGRRVPVVGRITMDMTMLDVTDLPRAGVGDEVVLIGKQGDQTMTVQELAGWADTSPYEMFCGISPRVPRIDVY
jgi:alanine racemase